MLVDHSTKPTKERWMHRFANGYGASVIQGENTSGGPQGLYELAVLKFDNRRSESGWDLCYDTPITNNIVGHLAENDVVKYLERIKALPAHGPFRAALESAPFRVLPEPNEPQTARPSGYKTQRPLKGTKKGGR